MSASKIGKSYNAESAWSSLGTPKGWQEYYDYSSQLPQYQRIFNNIATAGNIRPTKSEPYDQMIINDLFENSAIASRINKYRNNLIARPIGFDDIGKEIGNTMASLQAYPQTLIQNTLAGKYML